MKSLQKQQVLSIFCLVFLVNNTPLRSAPELPGGSTYQAIDYQHVWSKHWALPSQGRGLITFTANATDNIILGFSSEPKTLPDTYELILGGGSNEWSALRSSPLGEYIAANFSGLPQPGQDTEFWIIIDATINRLTVGFGAAKTGGILLDAYIDGALASVRYISFTNWHTPFTYRNILFTTLEGSNYLCTNKLWLIRHQLQLQRDREYLIENQCQFPSIVNPNRGRTSRGRAIRIKRD